MSMQIYYFSGTGNSLFVARELQQRLGAELIPIASLLDVKTYKASGDSVGFVFPLHAFTLPIVVKQFIQKTDFSAADYLFAIATREGTVFDGFEKMDKLLAGQRKKLNAHFIVNMPSNEAQQPGYTLPTVEQFQAMQQAVLQKLDKVQEVISGRQECREEDKEITNPAKYNSTLDKCEHKGGVQYFYADDKCVGCGLCRKICLSGKVTMYGRKPVWEKKVLCSMCFACLNYCPRNAVQIKSEHGEKSESQKNTRYPHPYATAEDIRQQKESV